jgi:hypothetical protein
MRERYVKARSTLLSEPSVILAIEQATSQALATLLRNDITTIKELYDMASALKPYWVNNPPDDRGRAPSGDQFPWIEVGEHAVGSRLLQQAHTRWGALDVGFPLGSDQRFLFPSTAAYDLSGGTFNNVWAMVDIKSVGPTDDQDHVVLGHNQVSGCGQWEPGAEGPVNCVLQASGQRASHPFHPSLPPIVAYGDDTLCFVATFVVKPVYSIESGSGRSSWHAQPLHRLELISIPNGLIMGEMLQTAPGLLFPGKDDKSVSLKRKRARIDLATLRGINEWRNQVIWSAV